MPKTKKQPIKFPYVLAFEGISGTGKSTQAKLLRDRLNRIGIDARIYHFPSKSTIGKEPYRNEWPDLTNACAFSVDRAMFKDELVEFHKNGGFIILDRYAVSTLAYQFRAFTHVVAMLEKDAICVDQTFLMLSNPAKALERIRASGDPIDPFEMKGSIYLDDVQRRMKGICRHSCDDCTVCQIIGHCDAFDIDNHSQEKIHEAVWDSLKVAQGLWARFGQQMAER